MPGAMDVGDVTFLQGEGLGWACYSGSGYLLWRVSKLNGIGRMA